MKELVAVGATITAKARELGWSDEDILEAIKVSQQVRRGAQAKMDRFAVEHVTGENEHIPPAGCECR